MLATSLFVLVVGFGQQIMTTGFSLFFLSPMFVEVRHDYKHELLLFQEHFAP